MERTDAELGWIAGFFDGEGHVSYRRGYPNPKTGNVSPALTASIPQASTNREVLDFFQSVVGFGKVNGPYKMPSGGDQHVLIYGVDEVEKLFHILKPNLKSEKTLDFQRALAGYWLHDPKPTAEDHARALKRNKKKGCPECENKEWNGFMCFECGYLA